ncbi:MAG TPA: hypothetical protein DCQ31_01390, partial [Bacteroidales bacterium]|nr:hypothetical protein [Bacteroidales bacterium]
MYHVQSAKKKSTKNLMKFVLCIKYKVRSRKKYQKLRIKLNTWYFLFYKFKLCTLYFVLFLYNLLSQIRFKQVA